MKLNTKITPSQEQEFEVADAFGGSSAEIRKHPEWSREFMNVFWNAETHSGTKGVEDCFEIAEYISSHPSKKDLETGQIGSDFDYLLALHKFTEARRSFDSPLEIPKLPLTNDGYVDVSQAKFQLQNCRFRFIENKEELYTGRVSINDVTNNTEELKIIMCEGNTEAEAIYDKLDTMARSEAKMKPVETGLSSFEQRSWNGISTILALDDMNIRGEQICKCFEYAGSIEMLCDLVQNRDSDMVDYVNQEMAKAYLDHDVMTIIPYQSPKAVTGQASFARPGSFTLSMTRNDWFINSLNADAFVSKGLLPRTVDYSSLDIMEGVDMETGFKIIESHGFEKYFDRTVKSAFDDDMHIAFFYNRDNGAIVEVSGAQDDDITYAGVTLKLWMDEEHFRHPMLASSGFGRDSNLGYIEFTHHNGLFKHYDEFCDMQAPLQTDRDKLGYQGIGDLPIPQYTHSFSRDAELVDELFDKNNFEYLKNDARYHLTWMIDMLAAAQDPAIDTDICPDYKNLKENPYYHVAKEHGGIYLSSDAHRQAHAFQFAASYLHMPTEERQKYFDAVVDIASQHGQSSTGDYIKNELSQVYLEEPEHLEDIYAAGIPKIENTPFTEFIPWINDELDFEKAVADIPNESGMKL